MSKTVEALDSSKTPPTLNPSPEENQTSENFSKWSVILWLAVSITATVFSYQLGIKQGKQNVEAEFPKQWLPYFSDFAPVNTIPEEEQRLQASLQQEPSQPSGSVLPAPAAPAETKKPRFTIQVVTYKSQKLANAEVETLKKKGHEAFVIPSGEYFQVCIDRFEDRKLAMKKLVQLRLNGYHKTYPGAFVKATK